MNQPNELSDFAPSSLKHLVGQRKVIEQVEVALDAAQQDGRKLDHALMVGPPGLGKSALAQVIAQEMATGFHEVLGQSLNSPAELNALLLGAKKRDIVFIDECHEMKKEFQTALFLALDKQKVFIKTGTGTPMGLSRSSANLNVAWASGARVGQASAPACHATWQAGATVVLTSCCSGLRLMSGALIRRSGERSISGRILVAM